MRRLSQEQNDSKMRSAIEAVRRAGVRVGDSVYARVAVGYFGELRLPHLAWCSAVVEPIYVGRIGTNEQRRTRMLGDLVIPSADELAGRIDRECGILIVEGFIVPQRLRTFFKPKLGTIRTFPCDSDDSGFLRAANGRPFAELALQLVASEN